MGTYTVNRRGLDDAPARRVATLDERILAATLVGIGHAGIAGLTLDDIAREAGCSRATVYRAFPGGKVGLIEAAVAAELHRFMVEVGAPLDDAESVEDLLVAALVGTARFAADSAPLQYLMAHEPEVVLSHVAFDQSHVVFDAAAALLAPRLGRFLDSDDVAPTAEWMARLGLSYLALPYATVDLTDGTAARRLVTTFVLPGLTQKSHSTAIAVTTTRS